MRRPIIISVKCATASARLTSRTFSHYVINHASYRCSLYGACVRACASYSDRTQFVLCHRSMTSNNSIETTIRWRNWRAAALWLWQTTTGVTFDRNHESNCSLPASLRSLRMRQRAHTVDYVLAERIEITTEVERTLSDNWVTIICRILQSNYDVISFRRKVYRSRSSEFTMVRQTLVSKTKASWLLPRWQLIPFCTWFLGNAETMAEDWRLSAEDLIVRDHNRQYRNRRDQIFKWILFVGINVKLEAFAAIADKWHLRYDVLIYRRCSYSLRSFA